MYYAYSISAPCPGLFLGSASQKSPHVISHWIDHIYIYMYICLSELALIATCVFVYFSEGVSFVKGMSA